MIFNLAYLMYPLNMVHIFSLKGWYSTGCRNTHFEWYWKPTYTYPSGGWWRCLWPIYMSGRKPIWKELKNNRSIWYETPSINCIVTILNSIRNEAFCTWCFLIFRTSGACQHQVKPQRRRRWQIPTGMGSK